MNEQNSSSVGGWPTIAAQETPVQEQPGMGAITAMADQVAAGVHDVYAAWTCFKYGQETPEVTRKDIRSGDRISGSYEELRDVVSQLRSLASEIRSRA